MKFTKKNTIINEEVQNAFKPELPLEDEIKGTVDDTYANAVKVHAKKEKEVKDAMKPAEEAKKDLEKMTVDRRETRKVKTKDMDAMYLSEEVEEEKFYEDPGFEYDNNISEHEYAINFAQDLGFSDAINNFPFKSEEEFKYACGEEDINVEDIVDLYNVYKEMYNEISETSDLNSNILEEESNVNEAAEKLGHTVEKIAKHLLSLPDYTPDALYVDAWNAILDACAEYGLDINEYADNAFDYLQELLEMGFENFYQRFKNDFDNWDRWAIKKNVEDVFYPEDYFIDDEEFDKPLEEATESINDDYSCIKELVEDERECGHTICDFDDYHHDLRQIAETIGVDMIENEDEEWVFKNEEDRIRVEKALSYYYDLHDSGVYYDDEIEDEEEFEESCKLDEEPKQKKEYHYSGPVYHFEKKIMDNWEATTMARSRAEALNNITFRAKKALGFSRYTQLRLNKDLLQAVETPKQKKEYYYNGPVYHFDTKILDNWEASTMARSEWEALNNITFKAKKALGFEPNTKLHLNKDLLQAVDDIAINQPQEPENDRNLFNYQEVDAKDELQRELAKETPVCDKCGKKLNDAGECVACDLNDESTLEESAENNKIKILDLCVVNEDNNIWYADPEEIFEYEEPRSWKGYIDRLNNCNLDNLTFNLDNIDTSVFIIDDGGELFRTNDGVYYEVCWRGDMCRVWEEDDDERIEYFEEKLFDIDESCKKQVKETLDDTEYGNKYNLSELDSFKKLTHHIEWIVDEETYNENNIWDVKVDTSKAKEEGIVIVSGKLDDEYNFNEDIGDWNSIEDVEIDFPSKHKFIMTIHLKEDEKSVKETEEEKVLDEEVTPEAKADREAIEDFLGDKIIKKAISTEFDEDSKYLYNYFSIVIKEKDFDEDKLDELFDNLEYYYDYDFNTEEGKYLGDLADTEKGQIEVRFKHLTAPETLDSEEEKDTLVECSKIVEEYTSEEDICRIDDELFDKAQNGKLIKKFEDGLDHYYMEPETQKVWLIKLNDDESINKIILF